MLRYPRDRGWSPPDSPALAILAIGYILYHEVILPVTSVCPFIPRHHVLLVFENIFENGGAHDVVDA